MELDVKYIFVPCQVYHVSIISTWPIFFYVQSVWYKSCHLVYSAGGHEIGGPSQPPSLLWNCCSATLFLHCDRYDYPSILHPKQSFLLIMTSFF